MAQGQCGVCRRVRGDKSDKPVNFCGRCGTNLCVEHDGWHLDRNGIRWTLERVKAVLMALRGY